MVILGVFVYCYYENNRIGRYSKIFDNKYDQLLILDSKSGTTYLIEFDGDGKVKINSQSIIK